jgi:hypothetical protein
MEQDAMNAMIRTGVAVLIGVVLLASQPAWPDEKTPPKTKRAWTLEEAQTALALQPHDPYLQYVVLQLARRENKQDEAAKAIEGLLRMQNDDARGRTSRADLFSIFTGALAVQESLQLDTMRRDTRDRNRRGNPARPPETIEPRPEPQPEPQLFTIKERVVPVVVHRKVPVTIAKMVPVTSTKNGVTTTVYKPVYQTHFQEVKETKMERMPVAVPGLPLASFSASMMVGSTSGPLLTSATLAAFASEDRREPEDVNLFTIKERVIQAEFTEKIPYSVTRRVPETTTKDGVTTTVFKFVTETQLKEVTRTRSERVSMAVPLLPLASFSASMMASSTSGPLLTSATLAAFANEDHSQDVGRLTGPTIKSHPWQKMLAGRKPEISALARCVPDDFYFAEFRSLNKLVEAMDISNLWSTHLYNQAVREARTQRTGERLREQLAVQDTPLLRPFYDQVVEEVAVTGSDLYLREGSDVTLIFQVKQPKLFKARMDAFLKEAEKKYAGAKTNNGEHLGVPYVHVGNAEREVHVFSAYPRPDLHVRSNSLPGLKRVLDAIGGKDGTGKKVRRLGDTDEFAYIRTLLPRGAKEEDGLIYLSDPFIRRQVGPRVKLTEYRRLQCYNHLRMIGHGSMMYRTEFGKAPASLGDLVKAKCVPGVFGEAPLVCPNGGKYALSADCDFGVCSHHGHANCLKPCFETTLGTITRDEADAYEAFLNDYNEYWRTYFDPIAIRLQVSPERYRLETIVLPLIDNSIYSGLGKVLGGQPEALDTLPVPKQSIFSVNFRLNKDALRDEMENFVKKLGDEDNVKVLKKLGVPGKQAQKLSLDNLKKVLDQGLGNQIGLHIYDAEPHVDFNFPRFSGGMLSLLNNQGGRDVGLEALIGFGLFMLTSANSPACFSIPIQDTAIVDDFVDGLDAVSAALARHESWGIDDAGFKTDFYRIVHQSKTVIRGNGIQIGPVTWRFFAARIGKVYYIATKQYILEELIAADTAKERKTDSGPAAHAMIRVRPENWKKTLPDYRLGWAENHRQACLCNLGPLSHVGRAFGTPLDERAAYAEAEAERRGRQVGRVAERLHTVHFFCPDGGNYLLDREGRQVTCSIHGSTLQPRQHALPADQTDVNKALHGFRGMTVHFSLLEDGLRAVLTVDRKK